MPVDERTFAAEVAGWVTEVLNSRPDLPFSHALVEDHVGSTARRHDFRLYRRHTGQPVLTGEIKMPDAAQGNHPLNADLVEDALDKAFRRRIPTNRRRNSQTVCRKVGMTPQRCSLPPIPNRVTASVRADLRM